MSYRFRVNEEGALVLQVQESQRGYGYETTVSWRDATVSDIPVSDPFRSDGAARYSYDAVGGVWERKP